LEREGDENIDVDDKERSVKLSFLLVQRNNPLSERAPRSSKAGKKKHWVSTSWIVRSQKRHKRSYTIKVGGKHPLPQKSSRAKARNSQLINSAAEVVHDAAFAET
jgi:hypothetical protein